MEKPVQNIEAYMQAFYNNLSEKDKRHYSAIEAMKIKFGGVQYIADLFQCSRQTIYRGIQELEKNQLLTTGRSRVDGGGRKNLASQKSIDEFFFKCNRGPYCRRSNG
jgi:DeoR/GlpR family transcriptional regulator of sugar metabolism